MYLGISTKYLGATDTRGARISATTSEGKRHVYPYRYELNAYGNHEQAARQAVAAYLIPHCLVAADRANCVMSKAHVISEAPGYLFTVEV